jgi:hypothetical protein
MKDWIGQQASLLRALQGCNIRQWIGIEMAVREVGLDGLPQWYDDSIQALQLDRLDLVLSNDQVPSIVTYQNDTHWGLWRRDNQPPSELPSSALDSLYRERILSELPLGVVVSVEVFFDENGDGDISEVQLIINGHTVSLKAAEVYEQVDGSLKIIFDDESILVQVDGERPNK